MRLRPVPTPESQPTNFDELQASGNEIVRQMRTLVLDALDETMAVSRVGVFKQTWKMTTIVAIQRQARKAIIAWQEVEATATELIDQVERVDRGHR